MIVAKTVNGFTLLPPVYKIEKVEKSSKLKDFSTQTNQSNSNFESHFTALLYPAKKAETPVSPKEEIYSACYNGKAMEAYYILRSQTDYKC